LSIYHPQSPKDSSFYHDSAPPAAASDGCFAECAGCRPDTIRQAALVTRAPDASEAVRILNLFGLTLDRNRICGELRQSLANAISVGDRELNPRVVVGFAVLARYSEARQPNTGGQLNNHGASPIGELALVCPGHGE
jgi:hypothetical protein